MFLLSKGQLEEVALIFDLAVEQLRKAFRFAVEKKSVEWSNPVTRVSDISGGRVDLIKTNFFLPPAI